jgi:aromatic-L-amino-acid/L-tryptophan decarboxylase
VEAVTEPVTAGGDPSRDVPLAMAATEFRRVGHELVDIVATFLDGLPQHRLTSGDSPDAVRAALDAAQTLPAHAADAGELLRSTAELLFDHSLFNGHPRFFGYITSSPAPIGMLADLLAAAVNANVGAWRLAPAATEIEAQAVRWIAELVGYPRDCGGLFVSGGNMANMVGLFAARAAAAQWDIRREGVHAPSSQPLRVYASAETHTWIQKAADLAGIGTDSIRWIATDDQLRMRVDALRAAIDSDRADGAQPIMVIGTAGTVSTGAVDPLFEIAQLCRERGVWFHVDGAYGALAAAVPGTPADLQALRLADSVAVDPHKWLYAPLEAGCVLVRDAKALRNAFAYHPPYYHFGQESTNYSEYGPQNSRGFRALKVWLALRHAGRDGYVRMIGDDIRLSSRLAASLAAHTEFEVATQQLSITTFRYVPADLQSTAGSDRTAAYLNELNQAVLEAVQVSGDAFVSNAVVRGRYLLRACVVNIATRASDIDALPALIADIGRETDARLRPGLSP